MSLSQILPRKKERNLRIMDHKKIEIEYVKDINARYVTVLKQL
jgi:hypothetical protein